MAARLVQRPGPRGVHFLGNVLDTLVDVAAGLLEVLLDERRANQLEDGVLLLRQLQLLAEAARRAW